MKTETVEERSTRILTQLRAKYPGKNTYDLDGGGKHFVCELEPTSDHPEYDRAVEVMISTKPHKHLETVQHYTILSGTLRLHLGDEVVLLNPGDKYTVQPREVHWAESEDECLVEIYSEPGWTKEDHIPAVLKFG